MYLFMLADLTPPLPLLLLEVVVNKGGEAHWRAAVAPALPYIRNIITSVADESGIRCFSNTWIRIRDPR